MDIKLDDNDIKDFISNIKVILPYTGKTLRVNTNINYNLLYDSLIIFPGDLINIIHQYTRNQYNIEYALCNNNNYNNELQIINIDFTNIINDTTYTIDISYALQNHTKKYKYKYELYSNFPSDIVLIPDKQIRSNQNINPNESLCKSDLICNKSTPDDVVTVLIFVVNNLLEIMIRECKFHNPQKVE